MTTMRIHAALLAMGAVTGAMLAGCGGRSDGAFVTETRRTVGTTIVLPGIEGKGYLNRSIRDGLGEGGVPTAIEIYDWTLGAPLFLVNQISESRARRKGEDLAGYLMAFKVLYPDKPVFLIAHSGGCAVAAFAAEALPEGESIDGIVFLGASLSPDYDLTRALRHVNGKLISFFSPRDVSFLGVATTVVGTMDREHGSAAGRVGFKLPPNPSSETLAEYRKVTERQWEPAMSLSGNTGGHMDWADTRFVCDYVAPYLNGWVKGLAQQLNPLAPPPPLPALPGAPTSQPAGPAGAGISRLTPAAR
ncbi:MAG: hypothetical protein BIFFINMI_01774 [Phycisphaerae bacterium]|nr:hypothetical protein [Phycisphaerae bacterium]